MRDFPQTLRIKKMIEEAGDVENDFVEEVEDDDVENGDVDTERRSQDVYDHTLCEPAQSTCTPSCHKSNFR